MNNKMLNRKFFSKRALSICGILTCLASQGDVLAGQPLPGEGDNGKMVVNGLVVIDPYVTNQIEGPQEEVLTEPQKLAGSLSLPMYGGQFPYPPVTEEDFAPMPDPKDFNGVWYHNQNLEFRIRRDMYGHRLPYNMNGAKTLARRVKSLDEGKPFLNASAICRPPGPQWQRDLNMPFAIYQTESYISFIFEEYHGRWNVILDDARHPEPQNSEYQGYSTAYWDGDTLVVESKNFKQALWLDVNGTPMSANGKMIQRIRKVSNGIAQHTLLEITTTVDDPENYEKPWTVVRSFNWQPNTGVFKEYNCEEQIGDPFINADAGLVKEPETSE